MDIIRTYRRNVVENKNLVLVSIFLSLLIRFFLFYFLSDLQPSSSEGSFLWQYISTQFLSNKILSFALSYTFSLAIMSYAAYLNSKYNLIRTRTYLVYVCVIVVFSSHPAFVYMNSGYVTLFLFLICLDTLFGAYQDVSPVRKSYAVGFILAISSLFSIYMLAYLLLFWIGFKMMRSFNFKSFMTSILGVCTIYWLFFCFYLWRSDLSDFIDFFTQIKLNLEYSVPSLDKLIFYGFNILLFLIVVLSHQINSFQDKIRIRAKIYYLSLIGLFSLSLSFFLDSTGVNSFYIFEFSFALLLAHFFSLSSNTWQVYLFYIFIIFTVISPCLFSSF